MTPQEFGKTVGDAVEQLRTSRKQYETTVREAQVKALAQLLDESGHIPEFLRVVSQMYYNKAKSLSTWEQNHQYSPAQGDFTVEGVRLEFCARFIDLSPQEISETIAWDRLITLDDKLPSVSEYKITYADSNQVMDSQDLIDAATTVLNELLENNKAGIVVVMNGEDEELGEDGCENNECEQADCHRCYPRQNCTVHKKCIEFTEAGDAYTEEDAQKLGRNGTRSWEPQKGVWVAMWRGEISKSTWNSKDAADAWIDVCNSQGKFRS